MYARLLFFFNDTATTEIYTLSLHDALPICIHGTLNHIMVGDRIWLARFEGEEVPSTNVDAIFYEGFEELREARSEEHTSELQSRQYLVCRLLLEKKKNRYYFLYIPTVLWMS